MDTIGRGVLTCARYAYAPNYYHYCGPDTRGELGEYVSEAMSDRGLVEYLRQFEVMYPYLVAIAQASGIIDPLDPRVVEAYWVGNRLLDQVDVKATQSALIDKQQLARRLSGKELKWLLPKVDQGARLHHSFHVLNVFTRTGHHAVAHTVETMDQCRISWGQLINLKIKKQKLTLKSQKLIYEDGKLVLKPYIREVIVPMDNWVDTIRVGDIVSVHWGFACDRLTTIQAQWLAKLTEHHIYLANKTL